MQLAFEKALVEQCAPTLAGIKPASLFRISGSDSSVIRSLANIWDQRLQPLGIRIQVLKECLQTHACLIYVYRHAELAKLLENKNNLEFLVQNGYQPQDPDGILTQLSERLCLEREFPHEIGIFLGYPLSDVIGFMENQGRNYTYCGYWKSYGDPENAKQCCARYRSCTCAYKEMYNRGTPFIQLVVAA